MKLVLQLALLSRIGLSRLRLQGKRQLILRGANLVILVGMHDYYTGLDMSSFQVVADFALDGMAAGQNLASKFKTKSPGVWELTLSKPLTKLARGKLKVSAQDRQGNTTRIERTFHVDRE